MKPEPRKVFDQAVNAMAEKEHKMKSDLTNLLDAKSELEFTILEAKNNLANIETKLFNELIKTKSFEYLNINYRKLKSLRG